MKPEQFQRVAELFLAGGFSNENEIGLRVTRAKNHLGTAFGKVTLRAHQGRGFEDLELGDRISGGRSHTAPLGTERMAASMARPTATKAA